MRVAVQLFNYVNDHIIEQLNKAEQDGDTKEARRLVLVNAVLVYELADFAIRYLDQFSIKGIDTIEEVERVIKQKANDIDINCKQLEATIQGVDFPQESRPSFERDIQNKREIREMMLKEWENYKSQIGTVQSQAADVRKRSRAVLLARKIQAEGNLHVAECSYWIGQAKNALKDIEGLTNDALDLVVAPLTVERVQTLFLNPDRG